MEHPSWYLTGDVAAALGVLPASVRIYERAGRIPAADTRTGGVLKWSADRDDVRAVMDLGDAGARLARARDAAGVLTARHGGHLGAAWVAGVSERTVRRLALGQSARVHRDTALRLIQAANR